MFCEQQMVIVATWLAHCPYFQKLESTLKYQMFKVVWNVWRRFERVEMSVKMYERETPGEVMVGGLIVEMKIFKF